jgi:hypothetical protein
VASIQAAASLTEPIAWQNINPTNLSLSLSDLGPGPDLGSTQASTASRKNSQQPSGPNRLGPLAPKGEDRDRSTSLTHCGKGG